MLTKAQMIAVKIFPYPHADTAELVSMIDAALAEARREGRREKSQQCQLLAMNWPDPKDACNCRQCRQHYKQARHGIAEAIAALPDEPPAPAPEPVSPFGCKCWTSEGTINGKPAWARPCSTGGAYAPRPDAMHCEVCGQARTGEAGK